MAKTLTGVVSSASSDKTIVVTVRTRKTHPIYKKQYTVSTKFMAHDESNQAKLGDTVIISETRPISARKRFKLDKISVKALVRHEETFEMAKEITEKTVQPTPSKKKAVVEAETEIEEQVADKPKPTKGANK